MSLVTLLHRMTRSLAPWTYTRMVEVASKNGVAGALADGRIVRLCSNQYTVRLHAGSFVSRALAALDWAGPQAVLAGSSALHWWDAADVPQEILIAAPWVERPRGPDWLRVRRFATMPASIDVRGARVLLPDLAVVTAHSQLPFGQRAEALYRPLRMGLVTAGSVGEAAMSLARVRGRKELAARLVRAEAGAESHLEETADSRVLRGPVLAPLVRQHWVEADGATYRLDSFDAESLTAIEFDGFGAHGSRTAQRRDRVRDARLAAEGILTVRFSVDDVTERPGWCRRIAEETIAKRRHPPGGVGVPQEQGTPEEEG